MLDPSGIRSGFIDSIHHEAISLAPHPSHHVRISLCYFSCNLFMFHKSFRLRQILIPLCLFTIDYPLRP